MTSPIILCGNGCGHNHDSANRPTGCCKDHGPYMYFCGDCHDAWAAANPERVAKIRRLAETAHTTTPDPAPREVGRARREGESRG